MTGVVFCPYATCTQCGEFVINDTGFCPDCHGTTKKRWKKVRIKISQFEM